MCPKTYEDRFLSEVFAFLFRRRAEMAKHCLKDADDLMRRFGDLSAAANFEALVLAHD